MVTLSGANWAIGESVHIRVNDDAGQTWSRDVDVTAADDGTFSDQFNLPDSFIAVYSVTATGPQSRHLVEQPPTRMTQTIDC